MRWFKELRVDVFINADHVVTVEYDDEPHILTGKGTWVAHLSDSAGYINRILIEGDENGPIIYTAPRMI